MSCKDFEGFVTRSHAVAAAQNALRNQGYAVAVHGSRVKDIDLIAIPWTEETALTARMVAQIVADSIPGNLHPSVERKPHGRLGFIIHPCGHYGFDSWYVDLSVMPRRRKRAD